MPAMDEFALIRAMTGQGAGQGPAQATPGVRIGIGDDAAVVAVSPGCELLLTSDAMVQEIHFKAVTMTPGDVGYKAMASNISDIAAMGGIPKYALITLCLPPDMPESDCVELYRGLRECADRYGVAIVGGDTTSSPAALVVSVTLVGEAEQGKAIPRSGARPGDAVFVTGPLGGSAAGLDLLLRTGADARLLEGRLPDWAAPLLRCHRRPEPQVRAGRLLAGLGGVGALNDISDGLASEAWELAEASGVCLALEAAALPLEPAAGRYASEPGSVPKNPLDWILFGGEDYQLVGTVPEERLADVCEAFARDGLPTPVRIGKVREGKPGVVLLAGDGSESPVPKRGYNHFHP